MTTLAGELSAAADRDADGVAVSDVGRALTWADTVDLTGRLGAALDEAGVRPGDRVGVHHRKSAEAFLAMHAVVQRGAVAVPLDPTASPTYLATVVEQTGCRVIATHPPCRASAGTLAATGALDAVVGLDDPTPADETRTTANGQCRFLGPDQIAGLDPVPPRRPDPTDLAYIITTSGSTGVPKGIAHTHASALAYVDFKLDAYDLTHEDRVSDIAPSHFDISTLALWVTPAVGATNVVVPEPHQMLPASLAQLAAEERISFWYSVPYLLTQLLDRGNLDQHDLSALRWVLFGGEPFPPQVLTRLMDRLPGATFSNVYGPAEVNACTVHHLDGPPAGDEPIPIGRPFGSSRVRLVTPGTDTTATTPLGPEPPSGEPGEIWVDAPTMMTGYWRRPDLDRNAIATDETGRRWYRTGDLAHRLPDGNLVFLGRVDHQVKVRGHRVELEAVEAVLEDAPGVASAVATVARAEDGADVIVAGLAPVQGGDLDRDAVRRHAAAGLPAYAVPSILTILDGRLPVTGSGKLDRRAIRATLTAQPTDGGRP